MKNIIFGALFVLAGCNSIRKYNDDAGAVVQGPNDPQVAPNIVGAWTEPLAPPASVKDINPIHSIMLPSGRILMLGGSSNRNYGNEQGVEITDASRLKLVDNAAIFDPVKLTWKKVKSYPASIVSGFAKAKDIGVDLFCSGHILLNDGRALFAGGTQSYRSNFQGAKLLWTFDEMTETWTEMPKMGDGRWYPTLLPLPSGKIAIMSGLTAGASRTISETMDIFDPKTNKVTNINLRNAPGYPFGQGNILDHYPRILPLQSGKWLITGDGTGSGVVNRQSSHFMQIEDSGKVTFSKGPNRPAIRRLYGTALVDPNSAQGDILVMGGMPGVGDPGAITPKTNPTTPSVTTMDRYDVAANQWTQTQNFLGATKADARVGHFAVILPTGQFLAINGANYVQNRGTYHPILYTPNGTKSYSSTKMKRAQYPRFYHNVALLLPDGRVWVNGSNRDRAKALPDGRVDQGNVTPGVGSDPDVSKTDWTMLPKGKDTPIEKEFTKVEIFSPPYLFNANGQPIADNERPQINSSPASVSIGRANVSIQVTGAEAGGKVNLVKLGSATHAWDMGQKFVPLGVSHPGGTEVKISIPANGYLAPPGHYHLFYVNKNGVPSVGKIITLSAK